MVASAQERTLGEVARTLFRRRRMVGGCTLGAAALTAGVAFLIPARYAAEAVILPPQPEPSSQTMLMGALSGMGGLSLLGGAGGSLFRNPGDLYVGLLKSRGVAEALIARFHLQQLYGERTLVDTRKHLARRTAVAVGKDLLIHIQVEDRDARRAAEMANAYVDELYKGNSRLALTAAAQRRLFFEQQLRSEKDALAEAEGHFQAEQNASGLISPTGQSAALLRAVAELRAEIAAREVQARSVRLYAGPDNQEMRQVDSALAELRKQLQQLQGAAGEGAGDLLVPAGKLPAAGVDYLRKMRDLKYHETLFELLSRQYEAARLDEAKEAPLVQVVDRAAPQDKKAWPPRALFTALAGAVALAASSTVALRSRS